MKNFDSLLINNVDLYALFADDEMSDAQFDEIKALLKNSETARNHYYRMVNLEVLLRDSKGLGEGFEGLGDSSDMDFWHVLAQHEKAAPTIEVEEPEEVIERLPIKKIEYERPARTINRFSLATAVLSAAALLVMILYVRLAPPVTSEVASISNSLNAQWSSDLPIEPGTRMPSDSKPIRLTRGIVEFTTDEQVRIVLEAPAEFYFSSYAEVSMDYGRLFAHVSEQGYGFSVVTPNLKIVDLGTEFGVVSHIDGGTEVHLYQGKANLLAGQKYERKTSRQLTAGSAAKVDPESDEIQELALDEQALVRTFDSQSKFVWKGQQVFRLTDLLLGGDGFGTASLEGIEYEPATGAAVTVGVAEYREGPRKMMKILESPYLDGVFVPGSSGKGEIISSAGHRFDECPQTNGSYYSNVVCRKNCSFFDPLQQTFEQSKKRFSDSGFLYLHSNLGLTIDLDAVRSEVPGCRIASFSAFAGIVNFLTNAEALDFAKVDVWVLVDGQVRSSRKALRADEGYDIHVDLADQDRFLTLVVTDGGTPYLDESMANHFDSCGFAEPVFELVSQDKDR